jgi:hypothetical protein
MSNSETSFSHSANIRFATKLMMGELPVMENLKKRRPDIYLTGWNCVLCQQDPETYEHLWECSTTGPALSILADCIKDDFTERLSSLSSTVLDTSRIRNLDCWSTSFSSSFPFSYLVRGFIPTQLTSTLPSIVKKDDAMTALFDSICLARLSFREDIWHHRNKLMIDFETSHNITSAMKHSKASLISQMTTSHSTTRYSPFSSSQWRTWISQGLASGSPWFGFS